MCGISGVLLPDGERVDDHQLARMAEAMRRRGPDAQGVLSRQNYGLAHRRLKVIDLSDAANQPMPDESGKVWLVYNGEIYNFNELRRELEARGYRFRTRSDTEVVLHAYLEWNTGCFARFNGMFAIGILDHREGEPTLHLARDRFGIKPLFYAEDSGRVAFASELKPLMELGWVEREVDSDTLLQFLKFSHVPTPHSMLRSVAQLEPGFALSFTRGQKTAFSFWDPSSIAREKESEASERVLLTELETTLSQAVERQLVSDVPVGCFLSGGIDSSLLTILATEALGDKKLRTYSVGYRESEFNEAPFARQIAQAWGTEHREIILEPKDFFALIPELPAFCDQPLADPTLLSSLLLARLARDEVTVALSGDGGDELFMGYPQQRAMAELALLARVPRGLRDPLIRTLGGAAALSSRVLMGHPPFERALIWTQRAEKLAGILHFEDRGELLQNFVGTLGPLPLDRLAGLVLGAERPRQSWFESRMAQAGFAGLDRWATAEQLLIRTFLVDTVLAKTDRSGMAYGLEARVPFLDDEVVGFSARLPLRYKLKGQGKYLLRRLLREKLAARGVSPSLSQRRKQGFSIPFREWLRGDLAYLLEDYLDEARLRREGILSPEGVRGLVKEHLDARANHSHLLWSLISFQMWKERYL